MLHRWLHPLRGAVVRPDLAAEVVTPAYDTLDEVGREDERRRSPLSFLHALPTTARAGAVSEQVLERCAEAVARLHEGAFADRPSPFVAVYRLEEHGRTQTGLVADLDVGAIGDVVRGHEHTLREREDDLVAYLDHVGVQSSPVCLAAPDAPGLARALAAATTGAPDVTITDPGLVQQLWVVDDPDQVRALVGATAAVDRAVITDGHHRAAAAARHPTQRVLVALFPASELHVSGFHRVVRPPLPAPPAGLADLLADHGITVREVATGAGPTPGHAVLRTRTGSWSVALGDAPPGPDVRRLHDHVLAPVLDVTDPRRDRRLHLVPSSLPSAAVDDAMGPDGVAFTCVPPTADDLLAAARDGRTLPPKSTYVRPKARSGLLLVPRWSPPARAYR